MKLLYALLFSIIFTFSTIAQKSKGDIFREKGNLTKAIEFYTIDFHKNPTNYKNTYNLACAYALTYQKDSAFYYLNITLKKDRSLWALADSDLYALTNDIRWKEIENYQLKKQSLQNTEYAKQLLSLIIKDQALDYYIKQARSYFMKNAAAPQWYYPLGAYKEEIANSNFETMKVLISKNGWPTYSTVGELAADAPLLVINHHKSNAVRKQYLPQIKKSCLNKEGSCMEYAKIQDRILVEEGKSQLYGMQFKYNSKRKLEPFPISKPQFVDKRRAKIGLEPLKVYLKRKINYNWNVQQEK